MDFELTEEHKMLRKAVQDFAGKEIAPIAQEIDKSGEFPWDCARKMAGLGLFGLLTPPAFGGTGPDRMGFLIALEEISAASAGLALALGMSGAVSAVILALGSDEQKENICLPWPGASAWRLWLALSPAAAPTIPLRCSPLPALRANPMC